MPDIFTIKSKITIIEYGQQSGLEGMVHMRNAIFSKIKTLLT